MAVLLVCIYINVEMELGISIPPVDLNLWDKSIRNFIKENIYVIFVSWVACKIFLSNFFKCLCIYLDKTEGTKLFPILLTVDDLIDLGCTLYFVLYVVNQIIELNHAMFFYDKIVCIVAGLYLLAVVVYWIYIPNSNFWYRVRREYTYYYDVNNKRIPKDAYVIYWGKLYQVFWTGDALSVKQDLKKEWRLMAWDGSVSISLEEAVKDKDGKLTIDTWEMGEGI